MLPPALFLKKVYEFSSLNPGEKGYSAGVDLICETMDTYCSEGHFKWVEDVIDQANLDLLGNMTIHLVVFSSWGCTRPKWKEFRDKSKQWYENRDGPADVDRVARINSLFEGLDD